MSVLLRIPLPLPPPPRSPTLHCSRKGRSYALRQVVPQPYRAQHQVLLANATQSRSVVGRVGRAREHYFTTSFWKPGLCLCETWPSYLPLEFPESGMEDERGGKKEVDVGGGLCYYVWKRQLAFLPSVLVRAQLHDQPHRRGGWVIRPLCGAKGEKRLPRVFSIDSATPRAAGIPNAISRSCFGEGMFSVSLSN